MEVLKIGDVDYSAHIEAKGIGWSRNDVDSEKTKRVKNGSMRRDKITTKRKLSYKLIHMTREQLAALGDQRSGYNVEAPAGLIRQMVIEGIQAAGISGGSGQPIQVNVMLDKRVLARAMVNEVNDMTRQAGKPVLLI